MLIVSNLTPKIIFASHTLQLAGGKIRLFGEDNTVLQYDGERYKTNETIASDSTLSDPSIVIRHQIDERKLKIYNYGNCHVRVVGSGVNVPPQSQSGLDFDISEIDRISLEDRTGSESPELDIHFPEDSEVDEVDNEGLSDTLIEDPYSDQEDTRVSLITRILQNSSDAEMAGIGSHRMVFKVDPSKIDALSENDGGIIKVAKRSVGKDINRQEMQTWQVVRDSIERRLFCPITSIGRDHKYIVMKEATDIGSLDEDVVQIVESSVRGSIITDSDECEIPSPGKMFDIKSRSIGTYDGTAVMIDYPYGGKFKLSSDKVEEFESQLHKLN